MEFGNVPTGINKFGNVIRQQLTKYLKDNKCNKSDAFPVPENSTLVIDKSYLPVRRDELPPVGYEAWSTLAAGAAVHAYYAIGAAHNESMRKWFANSAFAAILFGLIGEIPQDDCSTHNDHSVRQSEVENIYSPDNRDEIRYDGNWIYGNWIEDEFGSLEDMGAIIDPEMFGDCILGMILPVVHYILTGSHAIEKLRIHDSQYSSSIPYYYLHTRVNKALCQCGISSENDQVLVINTTSSWVSKLKVLQIAMKRYQLNYPVRSVRCFCENGLHLTENISPYFFLNPVLREKTRIAELIAEKLVKSPLVLLFNNIGSLTKLKKDIRNAYKDALYHHIDGEYLTNVTDESSDFGSRLLGRLICFLKYAEPDSELFSSLHLKRFGMTRELDYGDYDEEWDRSVRRYYQTADNSKTKFILNGLQTKSESLEEEVLHLWKVYDVDYSIQKDMKNVLNLADFR